MSSGELRAKLVEVYGEKEVKALETNLKPGQFDLAATILLGHGRETKADLTFDFNVAINTILNKFPGRNTIYVTEVHDTLRGMGVTDYSPSDFSYIEEFLKRFGVLVVPNPKNQ